MKIYLLLLIFLSNVAFAEYVKNDFEKKQDLLQSIKKVIQNEESIARAYEGYILDKFKLASSISDLKHVDYLGTSFGTVDNTYFKTYTIGANKSITYRIIDDIKADSSYDYIQSLYESDTFRKRTFYYNNKIYIILKNKFAKHLYYLLQNSSIFQEKEACSSSKKYFYFKNHLTICNDLTPFKKIMSYHIDNYEKGPIIVDNDTLLFDTNHHFKNLALGAILYDYDATKYIKTIDRIIKVQ